MGTAPTLGQAATPGGNEYQIPRTEIRQDQTCWSAVRGALRAEGGKGKTLMTNSSQGFGAQTEPGQPALHAAVVQAHEFHLCPAEVFLTVRFEVRVDRLE